MAQIFGKTKQQWIDLKNRLHDKKWKDDAAACEAVRQALPQNVSKYACSSYAPTIRWITEGGPKWAATAPTRVKAYHRTLPFFSGNGQVHQAPAVQGQPIAVAPQVQHAQHAQHAEPRGQVRCWTRQDNSGQDYITCADMGPPRRQLRR